MAAVAALWENVVDTDIIRLDASRFDIATSLAAAFQLICCSCDWLSRENSRPHVYSGGSAPAWLSSPGGPRRYDDVSEA